MDGNKPNTRHRARIVELVNDGIEHTEQHRRFKLSINSDQYEDIMAYNEILQHLKKDQERKYYGGSSASYLTTTKVP